MDVFFGMAGVLVGMFAYYMFSNVFRRKKVNDGK